MGFFREVIGFALLFISWFNPFGLDLLIRILIFILGFDMVSLVPKLVVFGLNFFFPLFGTVFGYFAWTLLILVAAEIVSLVIVVGILINLILKPVFVFIITFLVTNQVDISVITAVIDLFLNLTHKI